MIIDNYVEKARHERKIRRLRKEYNRKAVLRSLLVLLNASQPAASLSNLPLKVSPKKIIAKLFRVDKIG